jgi:hypothetical protein
MHSTLMLKSNLTELNQGQQALPGCTCGITVVCYTNLAKYKVNIPQYNVIKYINVTNPNMRELKEIPKILRTCRNINTFRQLVFTSAQGL